MKNWLCFMQSWLWKIGRVGRRKFAVLVVKNGIACVKFDVFGMKIG